MHLYTFTFMFMFRVNFCWCKKRLPFTLSNEHSVVIDLDRYQNIQLQNAQKSVFRIYFINGASNKKMGLTKSLSFLDSNILCFMKKIVRLIFQKFIVNTRLKVIIYYKP